MRKADVKIGAVYAAKISNKVVPVRILGEHRYGGWEAKNLKTNYTVRIKSAAKLRYEIEQYADRMMDVVGYTYDAGMHCPKCTFDYAREIRYNDYVFGEYSDEDINTFPGSGITDMEKAIELEIIRDSEGNPIHAVFDTDESGDCPDSCEDCGEYIDTSWSGEAVDYVCDAFATYIEGFIKNRHDIHGGNVEVLDGWRNELRNCIYDWNDERIIMLYDAVREYERKDDFQLESFINVPYLRKVIRDALEQHARPGHNNVSCSICAGALSALNQLVPEEGLRR